MILVMHNKYIDVVKVGNYHPEIMIVKEVIKHGNNLFAKKVMTFMKLEYHKLMYELGTRNKCV